jgi:cellulose synthase/poly-beta-1,6-N-acetylglucosamine synthase-like glycosyltransferase
MSVLIPTYEECENIVGRLDNLSASVYPRQQLEILVIDSGSRDGTADAVEAYAVAHPDLQVALVRQETRAGKASAINEGIRRASGDLLVVTDAPTRFAPDALALVAARFNDPAVGAATGYFEVTGERGALQREESRFWRIRNALRELEAAVDSTPFVSGELCCFRRGLVAALDEDTLADDMNIALQVRRRGYRVVVEPKAVVREPRSNTARELLETKSRRAAGGIQELLRARDLLFSSRHQLFGMLIMPSAVLYYLPLRVPAALVLLATARARIRGLPGPLRLIATLACAGAAARIFRGWREEIGMLLFNEWIFLMGWTRMLTRRMDVRWVQERSTRTPVPAHGEER